MSDPCIAFCDAELARRPSAGDAGQTTPLSPAPQAVSAAEYIRMSTEHQQYSPANQRQAIEEYATRRGFRIVRSYADEGCSGVNIERRPALRQLLADVQAGVANYEVILVYDVSRWGRFQNIDESACYEFICHRAGIRVEYCAESFQNDGSTVSNLIKTLKRVMAGEFSRDLSARVRRARCRMTEMGFLAGGLANFGLRRMVVDCHGQRRCVLERGQHKYVHTDRIVLVHGPSAEVEAVRWAFKACADERLTPREIGEALAARGIVDRTGRPLSPNTVRCMLKNERYIGNLVYGRRTSKFGSKPVHMPRESWSRVDGVIEPIVDLDLFQRAQQCLASRERVTNERMLEMLSELARDGASISTRAINGAAGVPCGHTYTRRFGSLRRAYERIGYDPTRNFRRGQGADWLRSAFPKLLSSVVGAMTQAGAEVLVEDVHPPTAYLLVDREFSVKIVIALCRTSRARLPRWTLRLDRGGQADLVVVARMHETNDRPMDYLLLPAERAPAGRLLLGRIRDPGPEAELLAHRFDSLELLLAALKRVEVSSVMGKAVFHERVVGSTGGNDPDRGDPRGELAHARAQQVPTDRGEHQPRGPEEAGDGRAAQ
jgi:DNA invertase Pin-like site-specific DNA recombinase